MATKFQLAIKFTLLWEGGYVFNPKDPGGETKYGISKATFPNEDIRNLTLERAMEIYKTRYWDVNNLDNVPIPLCIAYFDSYVQHNPKRVKDMAERANGNLRAFIEARRQYYKSLQIKKPSLSVFDKGWMNRLNDLSKYCQIVQQDQQ